MPIATAHRCPYKGEQAERCLHRHEVARKLRVIGPGFIIECRDDDRDAKGEKGYLAPYVKMCAGYETK